MWIKEKPQQLLESGKTTANFLYKKGKIYVMDNHLCATWCWLQETSETKAYDLIHIDRHNDLLYPKPSIKSDLLEANIDLRKITFEEYIELNENHPEELNVKVSLFRWDNYILNLDEVYPNFFGRKHFITKEPYPENEFITWEYTIEEFLNSFHYWLKDSENGCIVNLDIDFFYSNSKGYYKLYSNELVKKVGNILLENFDKIDVLTIALSPECCGGWENAFRIMKIINEILDIGIEI